VRYHPNRLDDSVTDLPGQFVLGDGSAVQDGWLVETQGRWTLATHPTLRKVAIVGSSGERVGWLLGHGITGLGTLASGSIRLPAAPDWGTACEQLASELSGRFLLILVSGPSPRVYPDALGMLAAVYAPSRRTLASTSRLIPLTPSTPFNLGRIRAVNAPHGGMYPLGLTPRDGIERILPNHFLDLSDWALVRRWPTAPLVFDADPVDVQRDVIARTSRGIAALGRDHLLQSPLTAGRDTRAMLACTRGVLDRVSFFTAELPLELTGWRDVTVARAITERLGLPHVVLPHRRARRADLRDWAVRTAGETSEPRGWRAIRTFRQVARDRLVLNGWAGDIVRPIYWKNTASDETVTAAQILALCAVPPEPEFVERANRWLASLPTTHPVTVLDLLLAEQRGGCWAGIHAYAFDGASAGNVAPMCHEDIVRAMMTLPVDYRREMRFELDLMAREWPDLLDSPFNEQVEIGRVRRGVFQLADAGRKTQAAVRLARHDPKRVFRGIARRTSSTTFRYSGRQRSPHLS